MAEKKDISNIESKTAISSPSGDGGFSPSGAGGLCLYFIGIGGIGMSALARYFKSHGATVSGYDKTPTPLTRELEASGIAIHYNEDVNAIPKDIDAVVYTPAIPANHQELVYYKEHNYKVLK